MENGPGLKMYFLYWKWWHFSQLLDLFHQALRIQSPSQMMIGVYNHLLRKVFSFHYHSQKVIGSLGKRCWGSPREIAYLWGRVPWLVHFCPGGMFSTDDFCYSNRLPAKCRNSVVTIVGELQNICFFFSPWWSRWLRWSFDRCFSTWLETVQRGNHFYASLVGRPEHKVQFFLVNVGS